MHTNHTTECHMHLSNTNSWNYMYQRPGILALVSISEPCTYTMPRPRGPCADYSHYFNFCILKNVKETGKMTTIMEFTFTVCHLNRNCFLCQEKVILLAIHHNITLMRLSVPLVTHNNSMTGKPTYFDEVVNFISYPS